MTIQDHFVGPDCYWRPPTEPVPQSSHFFGNAWWIPFPPTLVNRTPSLHRVFLTYQFRQVIRYDDGPMKVLQDLADLELYVVQNSSEHIQRKHQIRLALRALDGQVVIWPYDHTHVSAPRVSDSPYLIMFPSSMSAVVMLFAAVANAMVRKRSLTTRLVLYASNVTVNCSGKGLTLGAALI